jgi:hypothetical protein
MIFISYSHKDEASRAFRNHVEAAQPRGIDLPDVAANPLESWHAESIQLPSRGV